MKKILLFFILLPFILPISAQSPYWTEDFSVGQGWTLDDNWIINGGKIQFYWSPSMTNFDVSAISPMINFMKVSVK